MLTFAIIFILSIIVWLTVCFYRLKYRKTSNVRFSPKQEEQATGTPVKFRKKPEWVINKVIYLNAIVPTHGCRLIADNFNRLYGHKNEPVSKSYVHADEAFKMLKVANI